MTGWFLLMWLSAGVALNWPDGDTAKLLGPMASQRECTAIVRQINEWKTPVFAQCVRLKPSELVIAPE